MGDRTLFERLRAPAAVDGVRSDPDRLRASMVANIERVLNAVRGEVPTLSEYGLPSMTGFVGLFPDRSSFPELEVAIKRAIELYEPRWKAPKVHFVPNDDTSLLPFLISGSMGESAHPVRCEGTINAAGRVRLRA